MISIEKYNLPSDFDKSLLESSYSLEQIGINELGWKYDDIIKVINILWENKYAILGGDIYSIENNLYKSTFDNWYLNKGEMNWKDFADESRKKAIQYITNYNNRKKEKKDELLYVIIYQKEQNPE